LNISIRLFSVVRALIVGGEKARLIDDEGKLQDLLGVWVRRQWNDGSVGIITLPFILTPSKTKPDKLKITFSCTLFNGSGQLQYPLEYK